jgi:hypothetical protein
VAGDLWLLVGDKGYDSMKFHRQLTDAGTSPQLGYCEFTDHNRPTMTDWTQRPQVVLDGRNGAFDHQPHNYHGRPDFGVVRPIS